MSRKTLRPPVIHADDDSDESDLEGVPNTFVHEKCGHSTWMRASIVRSYVRNPYILDEYGAWAWCAYCKSDAPSADCHWADTGQNMREYLEYLIAEKYIESPLGWTRRLVKKGLVTVLIVAVIMLVPFLVLLDLFPLFAALLIVVPPVIALIPFGVVYLRRRGQYLALVHKYRTEYLG